jgi:hypothetical protein
MEEKETVRRFQWRNLKQRVKLKDLRVDGRILK